MIGGRVNLRAVVALTAALVVCVTADGAACTPSAGSPAHFGTATSFDVRDDPQSSSSTNIGLAACPQPIVQLLSDGGHITATVTSANNGLLGPSGDVVAYTLYADSAYTVPIQMGVAINYLSSVLLDLLGLFGGNPSAAFPAFLLTTPGSNVAQGTYVDTLTINWTWNYCTVMLFGVCVPPRHQGSTVSTVTVTLDVTNTCQITATPDVDFGQAPTPALFPSIVQSIGVLCTKDLNPYHVRLGDGLFASNGRRNMANGGHRLQYDFFKAATNDVWGWTGSDRFANAIPANGHTAALFSYTARIYTDQPTPPTGIYTDSVVVDVEF